VCIDGILMKNNKSLYIGVMSGTSVDAIDLAIVSFDSNKISVLATSETKFCPLLRQQVLTLCERQSANLVVLGQITQHLSKSYAEAINTLLIRNKLSSSDIQAIGCHGQTVCHHPVGDHPFSMQLVNSSLIAAMTNITTVSDFRSMDIALNGQGAPLIPAFHQFLLSLNSFNNTKFTGAPSAAFLNIGGMANITRVTPPTMQNKQIGIHKSTIGFDTGPGNALIDLWALNQFDLAFDSNGDIAASGTVNEELLTIMLSDPYFKKSPPKSTGREYFNERWLEHQLALVNNKHAQMTLTNEDIMATLVQLTAQTICNDLNQYTNLTPNDKDNCQNLLWAFGGGCRNHSLMNAIKVLLPNWQIKDTSELGIESDYMEAIAFAWLAYCRINLLPSTLPSVTGANNAAISGTLTLPPS